MEWMSLAGCHCECLYGSRTILLLSRPRAYGTSRSILLDFRNREERMESKIELPDDLGDDLMVGIDVMLPFSSSRADASSTGRTQEPCR
jgi:hypothetical protein